MADLIASSGTLISASLESAGYYYQSYILDSLSAPFASSAGGFLYLIGAIIGITTYILSGEFKSMFWLLVSPGLFFSCIFIRVETDGSKWSFGTDKDEQHQTKVSEQVDYILKKVVKVQDRTTEPRGSARISKLFASYNKAVSSTVNQFIKVINSGRENPDELFMVRDQLFAAMNFSAIHSRGFAELFHAGFLDNCGAILENGRMMVDALTDKCDRCYAAYDFDNMIGQKYALTSNAYDYIITLYMQYGDIIDDAVDYSTDYETCFSDNVTDACGDDLEAECGGAFTLPFGIYPCLGGSTATAVDELIPQMLATSFMTTSLDTVDTISYLWTGDTVTDTQEEFIKYRKEIDGVPFTCSEIWGFAFLGAHHHAIEVYNYAISVWNRIHGDEDVIDFLAPTLSATLQNHEVFKLFSAWVGTDDPYMSISQIALRLLRKEYQKGSISAIESQYASNHSSIGSVKVPTNSEDSLTRRSKSSEAAWSERSRLLVSATTLPYYQGLGLFFLAVTFPFFAMLLILPGKYTNFFLWFGLWAWFKSWDVAFSIVMLLSDALYSMFILNSQATLKNFYFNMGLSPDMSVAIYSLRNFAPGYDLTSYYHMVAICLLSIPSITAYLFLGAFRGGQGLIAAGTGQNGASMFVASPKAIFDELKSHEYLINTYDQISSSSSQSDTSSTSSNGKGTNNSNNTGNSNGLSSSALFKDRTNHNIGWQEEREQGKHGIHDEERNLAVRSHDHSSHQEKSLEKGLAKARNKQRPINPRHKTKHKKANSFVEKLRELKYLLKSENARDDDERLRHNHTGIYGETTQSEHSASRATTEVQHATDLHKGGSSHNINSSTTSPLHGHSSNVNRKADHTSNKHNNKNRIKDEQSDKRRNLHKIKRGVNAVGIALIGTPVAAAIVAKRMVSKLVKTAKHDGEHSRAKAETRLGDALEQAGIGGNSPSTKYTPSNPGPDGGHDRPSFKPSSHHHSTPHDTKGPVTPVAPITWTTTKTNRTHEEIEQARKITPPKKYTPENPGPDGGHDRPSFKPKKRD